MGSSIYSDANQVIPVIQAGTVMTATSYSAAYTNNMMTRARFLINVSAVSGTSPSLVVGLQAQNPVSGTWVTVTSQAAITATGDFVYLTGPGSGTTSGVTDTEFVPVNWRLAFTITGTTPSFTFGGVAVELCE